VEHGLVGGQPAGGVIFGVSHNPEAIIREEDQFSFYDGGNLDLAFLGMAQADAEGNVNASKVGNLLSGCGGFINISQNAHEVVFCGTFTAKGLDVDAVGGKLIIRKEGEIVKFVNQVAQISYSGKYARKRQQKALFVTERAVFELTQEGMAIEEIAPGIDIDKDILAHMGFKPLRHPNLRLMDSDLFSGVQS
jgi:propionate CoA-transferase